MACCSTECNDCGFISYNSFLSKCAKCGSTNVDREHDIEYDFGGEAFIDEDKETEYNEDEHDR